MKTVRERLNPFRDKVIQCAEEQGRQEAYRLAIKLANTKDYPTFIRWLEDITDDKNIGLFLTAPRNLADNPWIRRQKLHQALDCFLDNVFNIKQLHAKNEELVEDFKKDLYFLITDGQNEVSEKIPKLLQIPTRLKALADTER